MEKTCKNCFHYKACSEMLRVQGYVLPEAHAGNAERCDTYVATADVVPKTEVERLEAEKETLDLCVKDLRFRNKVLQKCNEGLAKNCGDLELQVEEAIAFRKTQVEQIFADFGKLRCTNDEDYREFAELREKYVGGSTDERAD